MERRIPSELQMAALAHDLRTPMCIAAGAAQMALSAGGENVSTQLRQILQAMGTMDRMLSMMSDAPMDKRGNRFTADMLRSELLAMTAGKAQEKGQRLSIDVSALDGCMMEADYTALCRLLINLLSNAVKYTPEGGAITLRTQMERGMGRADRYRIRFIVADNGMGMTRGFMRRMFQPFARAQDAQDISGSGLGLSIAGEMARRLGADIRVRSRKGRGTTFVVNVPVGVKRDGMVS